MAVFKVDIVKSLGGASSRKKWRNTYYLDGAAAATVADASLVPLVVGLANIERHMHTDQVYISHATISTVIKGDTGPLKFRSIPVGLFGQWSTVYGDGINRAMMPLQVVASLNFGGSSGQAGKKHYRGAARVSDIIFNNGEMTPIAQGVDARFNTEYLNTIWEDGILEALRIPSVDGNTTTFRPVTGISFGGFNFLQEEKHGGRSKVETEGGLIRSLDDFIDLGYKIAQGYTILSAAGKITKAAQIAGKLVAAKALLTNTQPPALPEG